MHGVWEGRAFHVSIEQPKAAAETILNLEYYEKQAAWTAKYTASHSLQSAATAVMTPDVNQRLRQLKQDTRDPSLLQRPIFLGTEKAWGTGQSLRTSSTLLCLIVHLS